MMRFLETFSITVIDAREILINSPIDFLSVPNCLPRVHRLNFLSCDSGYCIRGQFSEINAHVLIFCYTMTQKVLLHRPVILFHAVRVG